MLGGLEVNDVDIRTSTAFLNKYFSPVKKRKRENDEGFVAADCGGGIGRVTFNLLLEFFGNVDIVEPNGNFLDTARQAAGEKGVYDRCGFIQSPLQEVEFEKGKYDVVWVQWVSFCFIFFCFVLFCFCFVFVLFFFCFVLLFMCLFVFLFFLFSSTHHLSLYIFHSLFFFIHSSLLPTRLSVTSEMTTLKNS